MQEPNALNSRFVKSRVSVPALWYNAAMKTKVYAHVRLWKHTVEKLNALAYLKRLTVVALIDLLVDQATKDYEAEQKAK